MTEWMAGFAGREAGPLVQFVKYALCGVVATGVDMGVFYLMSWAFLPALRANDPVVRWFRLRVRPVAESQRSRRFVINTLVAFCFSNITAYVLNILWVFQAGKYAWWVELGMFYAASGASIALGTTLGWAMIRWFKLSTSASYLGKLAAALLLNFVCRKFIIFRG